jgi:gas vesicle protein
MDFTGLIGVGVGIVVPTVGAIYAYGKLNERVKDHERRLGEQAEEIEQAQEAALAVKDLGQRLATAIEHVGERFAAEVKHLGERMSDRDEHVRTQLGDIKEQLRIVSRGKRAQDA